jgi:hypothetical protein
MLTWQSFVIPCEKEIGHHRVIMLQWCFIRISSIHYWKSIGLEMKLYKCITHTQKACEQCLEWDGLLLSLLCLLLFLFFFLFIKRRNVDPGRINVIEMLVWPTLGIMSTGHTINGAGLLTPLEEGAIVTKVTKVTMATEWLGDAWLVVRLVWLWCCRGIWSLLFVRWPPSYRTTQWFIVCDG